MKIGCYSEDGVPIGQEDLSTVKETVFEIVLVEVIQPKHYPQYEVMSKTIGYCSKRERAEKLIRDAIVSKLWKCEDIYCIIIYERPIEFEYHTFEYVSCWVYDSTGKLLDKRTFPTFWSEGKFNGRSEDEIRFKWGDLVEWCDGKSIRLAYVLATPQTKEYYMRKSEELAAPYYGDETDDTYLVIDDSYCVYDGPGSGYPHSHVDALHLFPVSSSNIPKNIMKKYQKIWKSFLKDLNEYRRKFNCDALF